MPSLEKWEPIMGKVIRIIDEYTVIIDVGWKDRVIPGMEFVIFEEGEEIIDPETNEPLGKIEYEKANIEVTRVQEKFSVAKSSLVPVARTTLSELSKAITMTYERQKLLVSSEDISELKYVPEMAIKVGDKVKQKKPFSQS